MSAAKGKVIGSITRNTEATLRTATEEQRIDLAATLANNREVAIVPAAERELAIVRVVPELVAESLAIGQAAVQARAIVPAPVRELVIVQVAELVLAIALVAAVQARVIVPAAELVLAIDRAAVQAQAIVRVVGELQHDQVAVVLVLDHLRARLAVPLRTKSVTIAHRPGLVPLPTGGDLAAAVAETTHEPVAAEGVIAWAAAE